MTKKLRNKKVLITAGPTREWMDPVRYLSNPSSGAMGIELARVLHKKGARVTLVLGPTSLKPPAFIPTIAVTTARKMYSAVRKKIKSTHAFISTAAVADWRFKKVSHWKEKKSGKKTLIVQLIRNPDILKEAGRVKKKKQLFVGFALETNATIRNAQRKLREKNLDLIIGNGPKSFSHANIHPIWIEPSGMVKKYPVMSKKALSQKIAQWLTRQWNPTN